MVNGIFYIDKEEGYSSRDVDNILKKKCSTKKTGHLGTLDPFATGLLIVALGEGTKFLSLFPDEDKEYKATLQLGSLTDTLDKTGTILETKEVPILSNDKMEQVLSSFLGKSLQIPPLYSARHVQGARAYQLARNGEKVELPPKEIEIKSISLLTYDKENKQISFQATVSKGTYIRSLGRDIATRLGTVGHLISLRRTRVGDISVDQAKPISLLTKADIHSPLSALPNIPRREVKGRELHLVLHGQKLLLPYQDEFVFATHQNQILGIYQKEKDNLYRCFRGIAHDDTLA